MRKKNKFLHFSLSKGAHGAFSGDGPRTKKERQTAKNRKRLMILLRLLLFASKKYQQVLDKFFGNEYNKNERKKDEKRRRFTNGEEWHDQIHKPRGGGRFTLCVAASMGAICPDTG